MKFEKSPSMMDYPDMLNSPSIIDINNDNTIFVQNQQDLEENYYSSAIKKNVIQTSELRVKRGVFNSPK